MRSLRWSGLRPWEHLSTVAACEQSRSVSNDNGATNCDT